MGSRYYSEGLAGKAPREDETISAAGTRSELLCAPLGAELQGANATGLSGGATSVPNFRTWPMAALDPKQILSPNRLICMTTAEP